MSYTKWRIGWLGLLIAAVAAMTSVTTASAVSFDQNVTPDYFSGSGNDNGSFTVEQANGVELGLRGKLRFSGPCLPQNIFNSNGDGTYSFAAVDKIGCIGWADGDTPEWNFEWSVNTDYDGSSGLNLADLTYLLSLDADPSSAVDAAEFDPISGPYWDHTIGDNTSFDGGDEFVAADAAEYATLTSNYNVAQQSWNYDFFDVGNALVNFDAEADGIYDITLSAFDGGTEVASVTIQVIVGEPISVSPTVVPVGGEYVVTTSAGIETKTADEAGIIEECLPVPNETVCVSVVVYDPSGGFVTGGGWINSPQGAMTLDTPAWQQDFSVDTAGWFGDVTADSGTAVVADGASPFSRFDGYRDTWPGTWVAELDVYLDPAWATGDGFDYSVAANGSDGAHQRDYIFHVGVVENYSPIVGKALLVNGSNNADLTTNPFKLVNDNGGNYYEVTSEGWYTIQHVFYDAGGHLAVDLNLLDSGGTVLWTATRENVGDTIPDEVGGNRYSWFTHQEVAGGLEVDNHELFLLESAEGKATFGFVSKYKKGAATPTGSTQFVFKTGDLNFHSNVQDWLVVTGNDTAKFKGEGTINGEGSYKFQIDAFDGDPTGNPDTFHIRIWGEGGVVYDNKTDQEIGGGQIIVHVPKGNK